MGRKIASILASGLFFIPGVTWALGLGKYQLNSYLDEPLDMEVELLQIRDLTDEELRIGLAKPADFENAGIDRVFFLNDLKFAFTLDEDAGTGLVTITSSKPVREPFVNFLMDVHWPSGRILREYTLLLDSRSYAASLSSALMAPAVVTTQTPAASEAVTPTEVLAPSSDQRMPSEAAPADQVVTAPESSATSPATPEAVTTVDETSESRPAIPVVSETVVVAAPLDSSQDAGSYEVVEDDTMWGIALANRQSSSISVQQTMLAIQRLNSDAFVDGNINLLKKGQVLRIPTEQQARSMETREALVEVAEQNAAWEDKLRARGIAVPTAPQASSTNENSFNQFESAAPVQGEVTLVSSDSAQALEAAAASGMSTGQADARSEVLQNELAISEERLDAAAQQSQRLNSAVSNLEQQLDTSRNLISVKDAQIAQLQAQLQAARDGQPSPVSNDVVETIPLVDSVEPAAVDPEQDQSVAGPILTEADVNPDAAAEQVADPGSTVEPSGGLMAFIMSSLLWIVGSIVALLVVIGGLLVLGRRKDSGDDLGETSEQPDELLDMSDADFVGEDYDDDEEGYEDGDFSDADIADEQGSLAEHPVDLGSAEDPIAEADLYVTYGRMDQAVEILSSALESNPQQHDVRMKLLSILADADDKAGFLQASSDLSELDPDQLAQVEMLQTRLAIDVSDSGEESLPTLDDLESDLLTSGELSATEEDSTTEFDDLTSLDESLDIEPATATETEDLTFESEQETELDLNLAEEDLSLDFEVSSPEEPSSDEEVSLETSDDDLSLDDLDEELDDLSLDFDISDESKDQATDSATLVDLPVDEALSEVELSDLDEELDDLSLDLDVLDEQEDETPGSATLIDLPVDQEISEPADDESETLVGMPALDEELVVNQLDDELDLDDDDFDFIGDADENATKLDLAKAYIDMGDLEGAGGILDEVLKDGDDDQKAEAQNLMEQVK